MPDPGWYVPKEKRKLPPSLKPASDWYVPPEQRATKAAPQQPAPTRRPGLPEPTREPESLDQLMEAITPEIEEGLRYVDPQTYRAALMEARKIPDRALRRNEEDRIRRALKRTRTYNKAVQRLAIDLRRRGDHEAASRLLEAQRKGRRGELKPVEVLKAGGALVMDALDAAHKYGVRSWTTPEREGDKPGEIPESPEWAKRIREEAKKGKAIPKAVTTLADLVAFVPGVALGAGVATAGALTDAATGRPVTWENFKKTIAETHEDLSDFFVIMGTDPLSFVGATTAGAAKNAMTATARSLKPAVAANTISKETAQKLVDVVGKIASKHAGTHRALPKVKAAFRGTVPLKGATEDALKARKEMEELASNIFGKKGEFFGKDQLALHVPFGPTAEAAVSWATKGKIAPDLGVQILPKITGKEYAGAKALQALHRGAVKPIAGGGEFRELFDPEKGFWKNLRRKAKAEATLTEQRLMLEYEEIAKMAPESRSRREYLVRNLIDPKKPVISEDIKGLTKQELDWIGELDTFFKGIHDTGVKAGYFDAAQIARNKYTRKYFPRQYKKDWGIFEDLPESKKRLIDRVSPVISRGKLHPKGSKEGLPLGAVTTKTDVAEQEAVLAQLIAEKADKEHIDAATKTLEDLRNRLRFTGEADPHRAVPHYIQQVSRGVGASKLEEAMLRAFSRPASELSRGDLGSFGKYTEYKKGVAIPNKALTFLEGSFDNSVTTFRNWVSKMPGSTTPIGRAALASLKYYGKTTNFWKRNVLVTRPGYHVVNFWNDTIQAMADGNSGYLTWLKRSGQWIGGEGKTLITPSGKYTGEELIDLARANFLPVDTVRFKSGRAVRIEAVGQEAANYHKFQKLSREGLADPSAYPAAKLSPSARSEVLKDKWAGRVVKWTKDYYGGIPGLFPKHGEALARAWESRAKLAHFAWRLKKGDSPAMAAQRTLDVLLDYADPGRHIQVARWFVPFATWTFTAPRMTARLIAKRPAAVSGVQRFFETQEGEKGLAPRSYISERSPYHYLGPRGKQTLENLRYLGRRGISPFTGETAEQSRRGVSTKGQSAVYMPRDPFGESLTMPMEVSGLSGLIQRGEFKPKPEPAVAMASPLLKGLGEIVSKKDVLTGRDMERPGLSSLFPARTPLVPRELRASREDEIPWLSRYVLPQYMPPGYLLGANLAAYRAGGGEAGRAPLSTIGSYRPYAPPGQAPNIYAQQLINMMGGIPSYTVSPADQPYEFGRHLSDMEKQLYRAKMEAKAAREATRRGRR